MELEDEDAPAGAIEAARELLVQGAAERRPADLDTGDGCNGALDLRDSMGDERMERRDERRAATPVSS